MTPFGRAFHVFMSGDVICPVSHPDLYDYLIEQEGLEQVEEALTPLDLKVSVTTGGGALYLSWKDGSSEAKKAIQSNARAMQEEFTRVQAFVSFMLEIDDTSGEVKRESLIRLSAISAAIDRSSSLRDGLSSLAITLAVKGSTDHSKMSAVLSKLKDMGYLKLIHREKEDYVVTGKIDLFYDIVEHFGAHIGAVEVAVAKQNQGDMFA